MIVVYLIGSPGSGKTTAVTLATRLLGWGDPLQRETPIPHLDYGRGRIQLGRQLPLFGGTDALGMAINPRAVEFISGAPANTVIAEGDRLSNRAFFDACRQAGVLRLIHLRVPATVANSRADLRAATHGLPRQGDSWRKGRQTKINNLLAAYPHQVIDGGGDPDAVAAQLAEVISLS